MKGRTKAEIIFVLLVFGLIYYVVNSNVSITGFSIQTPGYLNSVSPTDNYEVAAGDNTFMFQYSPEIEMKQCTLKLGDQPVKTINSLLSSTGTRIKLNMQPGEYYWSIECYDMHDTRYDSVIRHLGVLGKEKPAYTKTAFYNKNGYIYGFDITDTLDLIIPEIQPNDVLRAKQGVNTYEAAVILLSQDYSIGLNFIEFMLTPGTKRIRLEEGNVVSIDFNNDGTDELVVKLESVAYRKATLSIKSAQLVEQKAKAEQQPSPIPAPIITVSSTTEDNPETALKPEAQSSLKTESNSLTLISLVSVATIILLIILIAALSNYYFHAPKEKKPETRPTTIAPKSMTKTKSSAKRKAKKKAKSKAKVAKKKKSRKTKSSKKSKPKQKKAKKRKR